MTKMSIRGETIAIIVIGIMLLGFLAWGLGFEMMGGGMMGSWSYGGSWWMPLVMLGFVVLIGFGIYYLVVGLAPSRTSYAQPDGDRALSIARERLARGEITPEEYERIRKLLSG